MRIEPNLVVAAISSEDSAAKPRARRNSRSPASVVSLSPAGSAVVSDDAGVMSPRVETLRMMVERGTYHVDLDTLASRIVDDDMFRGAR